MKGKNMSYEGSRVPAEDSTTTALEGDRGAMIERSDRDKGSYDKLDGSPEGTNQVYREGSRG